MESMSKALIAKQLPKVLVGYLPWTRFLWSFTEKARRGLDMSWQNLSIEEVHLTSLPVTLKHSDLLGVILKTFKEVCQHMSWKGLPEENVDSSLTQSVWWARNIVQGQQPGIWWKKEGMTMRRKGIHYW
eukprot:c6257_g1_i1 orf=39-425(+)